MARWCWCFSIVSFRYQDITEYTLISCRKFTINLVSFFLVLKRLFFSRMKKKVDSFSSATWIPDTVTWRSTRYIKQFSHIKLRKAINSETNGTSHPVDNLVRRLIREKVMYHAPGVFFFLPHTSHSALSDKIFAGQLEQQLLPVFLSFFSGYLVPRNCTRNTLAPLIKLFLRGYEEN